MPIGHHRIVEVTERSATGSFRLWLSSKLFKSRRCLHDLVKCRQFFDARCPEDVPMRLSVTRIVRRFVDLPLGAEHLFLKRGRWVALKQSDGNVIHAPTSVGDEVQIDGHV